MLLPTSRKVFGTCIFVSSSDNVFPWSILNSMLIYHHFRKSFKNTINMHIQFLEFLQVNLRMIESWLLSYRNNKTSNNISSHAGVLLKNVPWSSKQLVVNVLQNVFSETFAKFTGKHQCWSLIFNKVADLRCKILLKKRLQHRHFLWILQNL